MKAGLPGKWVLGRDMKLSHRIGQLILLGLVCGQAQAGAPEPAVKAQPRLPDAAEILAFARANWSLTQSRLRIQGGLGRQPMTLLGIPKAFCRRSMSAFQCAWLVEWKMKSGQEGSTILVSHFARDPRHGLLDMIVIRELPQSPAR
jgi:hypothetical protein